MIDIGAMKSLDQVLMGYIPNFIKSKKSGVYLAKLMEDNINNSNFIAFAMAEIYNKYSFAVSKNDDELKSITEGVRLVIGKLLDDDEILDGLKDGADKAELKMINGVKFKDKTKETFFELLSGFAE